MWRRWLVLGVVATLAVVAAVKVSGSHAPAAPPAVELDELLDQGPAAVAPLMQTPLGPAVTGELQRRGLADTLRTSLAAGYDTVDLGTLGADGGVPLDPNEPAGTPVVDGKAALRRMSAPGGPLLVRSPPEHLEDYLAACMVRGFWCLVVEEGAAAPAWDLPADGTAADYVERAGSALPAGTNARWLNPVGPDRVRIRRP